MRVAIVNWSSRKVGGIETYLSTVIPELNRAGHEVAFWHEVDVPLGRERIRLADNASSWCVADIGAAASFAGLRAWRPDVLYSHKVADPVLEAATLEIAPAVYFAHDYQGMCISGSKTFKFPVTKPCGRRFDSRCLAHYFPHRCGGLNPLTMFKLYQLQTKRLALLRCYDAIVTHSEHMLTELLSHGLPARQAYSFPYYVQRTEAGTSIASEVDEVVGEEDFPAVRERESWHLLFSGRMELLKGGHVFLDALPAVLSALRKPLRVTLAGDGRERAALEKRAARLQEEQPALKIEFTGWASRPQIDALLADCDLLVVPSLWPEPFGLVGPEAGLKGVPVAAFAVGGIADWLEEGVNGYFALGDPPTSAGLAQAIVKCVGDPATHDRLCRGAVRLAQRFSIGNHIGALLGVFEKVVAQSKAA